MKFLPIILVLSLFALSGCENENDNKKENVPTQEIRIKTNDVALAIPTGKEFAINLFNAVSSSIPAELYIEDITSLDETSDSCQITNVEGLSLEIYSHNATACTYNYTITDKNKTASSRSTLRVNASPNVLINVAIPEDVLMFSAVAELATPIHVDVGYSGFTLNKNSISVLGSGTAVVDLLLPHIITYTPGAELDNTGVARILFSYVSDDGLEAKLGTLDVTVSSGVSNFPPVTPLFRFGDLNFKSSLVDGSITQLPFIAIPVGTEIVIDLALYFDKYLVDKDNNPIELVNSDGDPIVDESGNPRYFYKKDDGSTTDIYAEGLILVDGNGDEVQLVKTMVYNATALPIINVNSTQFLFSANSIGTYYVTYTFVDELNAYSSGIIEVRVGEVVNDKPWFELQTKDGYLFSAPLSGSEAINLLVPYQSITNETGNTGPDGFGTPQFSWENANAFCKGLSTELPTVEMFSSLKQDYPMGLFSSLDVNNPVDDLKSITVNWPTKTVYWTKTPHIDASGNTYYYAVPLNADGNYDANNFYRADSLNYFSVTCVIPANLKSISATSGAYQAPLDSINNSNKVTAYVEDLTGQPVAGVEVLFYGDDGALFFPQTVLTDENGQATTSMTSRKSGDVNFKAKLYRTVLSGTANFTPLPRYVRAIKGTGEICYFNTLEEMAGKPCSDADLSLPDDIYGYSTDAIIDDGQRLYRTYGSNVYVFNDMLSAYYVTNYPMGADGYGYLSKYNRIGGSQKYGMLYDGIYYWRLIDHQTFNAYSTVTNMINNTAPQMTLDPNGNLGAAMAYDKELKLYIRTWKEGGSIYIRGYKQIADMVDDNSNHEIKIAYPYAFYVEDKFIIL